MSRALSLTAFDIKVIAVVCMVVDHVGLFFFPHQILLRDVGRIAFPLFSWLIANGAHFSHAMGKYLQRLFILAVVSQIPFTLANQHISGSVWYFNVVFTLFLGLTAIYVIRSTRSRLYQALAILLCTVLAIVFNTDYGAAGVLSIVGFYVFFNSFAIMFVYQSVVLAALPYVTYALYVYKHVDLTRWYPASSIEVFGMVALLFIYLYNKKPGLKVGLAFYYFYPAQYIIIYIFQLLLH